MLAIIGAALLASAGGWWALKQGEPWLYGLEAYVYGFPLIMMDLTKEVSTAVPTAVEFTAPVNQFAVMTHYPDASFRAVVRTGLDTLFAVAWADLAREPLVVSVPDTNGRYYVIALLDMWTNVFASIGKRTTGTGAANFLIAGPDWQGTLPADVKQTFRSPTRFVWVNGQMQADGPQDYAAVNALQKQYKLTPLSVWGQQYAPPAEVPVAAGVDRKTPPLVEVQKMDAGAYFGRLAWLLKDNPPAAADGPMVEKLKTLGIEPGEDFHINTIDPDTAKGLQRAMGGFEKLQEGLKELKTENGWRPRLSTAKANRWMEPTATSCILTRARRRPPSRPGRYPCTTRRASTCRTPSTVTTWPHGCRSNTTPTGRSIFTSRRVRPPRTRRPTGCPRRQVGRSTSRCVTTGQRKRCSTAPTRFRR